MRFRRRLLAILFCLTLIPASTLMVLAQDADGDGKADPPARAARLQYMSGSVSVQPHGSDDWVAGALNRPLTNSDNIWADKDSRAEISLGTGLVRLDSESSLTLTNVDQNTVQLQLHQGAMNLHVRRLYDGETYEVDTPNQAFAVSKPGDYRFDVDSDNDKTVITVWRGEGESRGTGPAVRIREGQQARFADGTNTESADLHAAPSPDGFDDWARSRDEGFDRSASAGHVSPDVVGYEDLDEYGSWRETPQYGSVWVPTGVSSGWAPYRNGHWIWVDPWGWTWMEDEPWGYAPFHYGRWVYYNNYWGWAPGPVYARPYYAPALVAWFGGPAFGVSVGFGGGYGYGWCALGFGEPYVPWYGVSRGYFNRVNITNTHINNLNVTNIYNSTYINRGGRSGGLFGAHDNIRYANMRAPNGFTAVSRETLLNSQNAARNAMRVSPSDIARVTPVHSLDMKPTMAARLGTNAGMRASAPPPRSYSRPVVSRATLAGGVRAGTGIGPRDSQRSRATFGNPGVPRPMANGGGQRPINISDRNMAGPANTNIRVAERGSMSPNNSGDRMWGHSVPRPPNAAGMNGGRIENGQRSSVARPSMGTMDRPNPGRMSSPNRRTEVPRPSPSYQAGNRGYSNGSQNRPSAVSGSDRGSYGRPSPAYNREAPSYGRRQGNAGPSNPHPTANYGGGSYGRPAPSYERGSVGRSMPSYGSGRSMGSYPGSRAPSYGGGGGGRSGASGGGGGHVSARSGGGGHNSGGGGRGRG